MASDWDQFQYSTVKPLLSGDGPQWVPEEHRERIQAYTKYEEIYWSSNQAFQLMRRGTELQPIFIPNGKTIVDNTAHYMLKGMQFVPQGMDPDALLKEGNKTGGKGTALDVLLKKFIKREKVMSRLHMGKHVGVVHGDWIVRLEADVNKPEGSRVSLTVIDPARYFPVRADSQDLDKITSVILAEVFKDTDGKAAVRKLEYILDTVGGEPRVFATQTVYEPDTDGHWFYGTQRARVKSVEIDEDELPADITSIPVYHFKNADWTGQDFGSSELRGYERVMEGVNQTISDTELALALEGLGVYSTDAGTPTNIRGEAVDWEIGPGKVMELPIGAFFKRVEGIASVDPVMEFTKYLEDHMRQSSSTFMAGEVDVAVAQSGIALQIRFLPTLAKVEERDLDGVGTLEQVWYDWTNWMDAYEGTSIGGSEINVVLGDKLPIDRAERQAELNNMYDRKVISGKYYRQEMTKLGYVFPPDAVIEKDVQDEQAAMMKIQTDAAVEQAKALPSGDPANPNKPSVTAGNKSNNAGRSNESGGSEAGRSGGSRGSTNGKAK